MELPNGDRAVVDEAKLRDYCLDLEHPRGRHKARVFAAALGITAKDSDVLRDALLSAARNADARPTGRDDFGERFVVEFFMDGPSGRAWVRSSWIVRRGEDVPRLTTCHVL